MRGRPDASAPSKRTPTVSSSRTLPPDPRKRLVSIPNSRIPPSSCELEVRNISGHSGHGVDGERRSGGRSSSSIEVTDAARCRCEVPTQSEPVSPPPRITTCLPVARISLGGVDRVPGVAMVLLAQEFHREMDPREIPAFDREIPRLLRPAAEQDRVEAAAQLGRRQIDADVDARLEGDAFLAHLLDARVDQALLELELRESRSAAARRCGRSSRTR